MHLFPFVCQSLCQSVCLIVNLMSLKVNLLSRKFLSRYDVHKGKSYKIYESTGIIQVDA